ncbi:MAG: AI-2E family transporter [Bifidobacteriaceae bacterium]|nr:AI-2E family transporter [Bifidobacteriaceae bacterium]
MKTSPPPWLTKAAIKIALVVMGAILLWNAMGALFPLLMVVMTALFISLAIEPPVDWLVRKGWKRGLATGTVMLALGLVVVGSTAAFGNMFVNQMIGLVEQIPEMYEQTAQWLADRFGLDLPTQNDALQQLAATWGAQLAKNAWAVGTQVFAGLISALGLVLLVFYISAQGPKLRATICSPLPPEHQRVVLRIWATAQEKTAGYISSRVILAVINSAATFICLTILGVRYALPLALFCGVVSQFVPTVGTYIGGAGPVLFALLEAPVKGLVVLIFIIAYQQIENLVLAPKLTSKTMEINPAVAFVSVIALGTLMGPIGALLSLPLVATCQAVVSTYLHRYELVEDVLLPRSKEDDEADGEPEPPAPKAKAQAE